MRLRLGSTSDTKRTFQRVIAAFAAGKLDPEMYRGLIYGLSAYIGLLKAEADIIAVETLERLEKEAKERDET